MDSLPRLGGDTGYFIWGNAYHIPISVVQFDQITVVMAQNVASPGLGDLGYRVQLRTRHIAQRMAEQVVEYNPYTTQKELSNDVNIFSCRSDAQRTPITSKEMIQCMAFDIIRLLFLITTYK